MKKGDLIPQRLVECRIRDRQIGRHVMADVSHERCNVSPAFFLQANSQQFGSFQHLPGDQLFFTRCHCALFF